MEALAPFIQEARRRPPWYWLIGDLVILCIALGGPALEAANRGCIKPDRYTAWSETQTIIQAITTYQTDNAGDCPPSMNALVDARILPKNPIDPWGQPFNVRCPGTHDPDQPDVWSSGKDRRSGTNDDVVSWRKREDWPLPEGQ